jgi:protein-disulfide isomerase
VWQNATQLAACQQKTLTTLNIDAQKVDTCAGGSEGLALLTLDETIGGTYGVSASPTLVINGQVYSGDRTPEAYKQAICARFETPPAECATTLSSQAGTSSGGCG